MKQLLFKILKLFSGLFIMFFGAMIGGVIIVVVAIFPTLIVVFGLDLFNNADQGLWKIPVMLIYVPLQVAFVYGTVFGAVIMPKWIKAYRPSKQK